MTELWKAIPGFTDKYECSTLGRIRSKTRQVRSKANSLKTVKGKVLKTQITVTGYESIALSTTTSQKTISVHQLVMMTFVAGFIKGTEINHKDGNPLNNCLDNLEVSNPSHNQFHAVATGLRKKKSKSKYNNVYFSNSDRVVKRWFTCIRHNGKNIGYKSFATELEAAVHADFLLDSVNDTQRNRNFS